MFDTSFNFSTMIIQNKKERKGNIRKEKKKRKGGIWTPNEFMAIHSCPISLREEKKFMKDK